MERQICPAHDQSDLSSEKQPELLRRRFLIGAAATAAASLVGCTTSSRSLPKPGRAMTPPSSLSGHKSYERYIASLRLRYISPNELLEPHYNRCRGVRNCLPPKSIWSKMEPTLRVADEVRRRLGLRIVRINSAYRSPYYNSRVRGAARDSYHIKNQALDIKFACRASTAAYVARQLRAEGFFSGGIGIYSTFIHIDTRGTNATWWS